jgi:hypothetical protein
MGQIAVYTESADFNAKTSLAYRLVSTQASTERFYLSSFN